MNDAEVSKQILQMVQFIKQEAEEKASEIAVAAEEEFNIEKLQIVEAEKQKIRKEYERKEGLVDVKKKMCERQPHAEYSTQLNATRLKVLAAREESMRALLSDASTKLAAFSQPGNAAYKALLVDLIAQAVTLLEGAAVTVRCRQADLGAVQEAAGKAKSKLGKDAQAVTVDTASFLPPGPNPAAPDAASCLGGVVVGTADGKIKVSNTLDERLREAYDSSLPQLRTAIFGKNPALRA